MIAAPFTGLQAQLVVGQIAVLVLALAGILLMLPGRPLRRMSGRMLALGVTLAILSGIATRVFAG